jgi:restriction system protein
MMQQSDYLPSPHVPHYPQYESVIRFIQVMDGQSLRSFYGMRDSIHAHVGTPQETQDWTQPEEWIPVTLAGDEAALAEHLWEGSNHTINPRHLTGVWLLSSGYELLAADASDMLHITDAGHVFITDPFGEAVKHIDYSEGLLNLLLIVSEHGPGKRSDLLPPYTEFLEHYSNYRSPSSLRGAWYNRMRNLAARGLVLRSGVTYEITQEGLAYLEQVGPLLANIGRELITGPLNEIRRLLRKQNEDVRERLRETLGNMDPYAVEFLVKRLLEAMEYENVEVTSRSGDGGVDVVADIEMGITLVREVVQVKRRRGNIQRRVLDELRGSLHRFDATQGTIITTGDFSKGAKDAAFERGAAPITLIDGDRLIDLLIEHEIGARKRSVPLIEFEPADFVGEEDVEE